MSLIIVNSFGLAATEDQVAYRYLKDSLRNFEARELATYGVQGLPHPVAIPKPSHTPQDGGASEGAG